MIIEKGDINKYNNKGILMDNTINFYYYINYIRPEFRINLLKKEIFRNIPKVIIDKKDLLQLAIQTIQILIFYLNNFQK